MKDTTGSGPWTAEAIKDAKRALVLREQNGRLTPEDKASWAAYLAEQTAHLTD